MNKILIKIAEQSPKKYANSIIKRNNALLKNLMLLKPYIGKDIPSHILSRATTQSKYGCPHCKYHICSVKCLWRTCSNYTHTCLDVPFSYGKRKGVTMHELCILNTMSVCYFNDSENIECRKKSISRKDFNKCVDFIKAHIEWAKLPIWGNKYSKSVNK